MFFARLMACMAVTASSVFAASYPLPLPSKSFFDFTPPSDSPSAKSNWKLVREAPGLVNGPIPIILIHGQTTDRWGNFIDWASNSPETEAVDFRDRFQLWNYLHSNSGVNAPIGYSSSYPAFSESIVAYLDRFIRSASSEGVVVDNVRYVFPPGPFGIIAHSQGGLVARAFLVNFPQYASRVFGVVTLSAPHMGTPWATPEWVRCTVNRVVEGHPWNLLSQVLQGLFCQAVLTGYFSTGKQSDLDMGWLNYDHASGFGLPVMAFQAWEPGRGFVWLQLSPRDSTQTNARTLPGYSDTTFEPQTPLSTYCGGLDAITPKTRGGMSLDKFFLYGGYIEPAPNWKRAVEKNRKALYNPNTAIAENAGLAITDALMGLVPTAGTDAPVGAYRVSDGFVPLQSQLMLDGKEGSLIYDTWSFWWWRFPTSPVRLKEALIRAHTLGEPDRLRIYPGYSHLDMVTGKYNAQTKHSDLFTSVARDLLSVAPTE